MWQVHHHYPQHQMASSNYSIIKLHPNPNTTTLNPNAPAFEAPPPPPPPPHPTYHYSPFIKRLPLYYHPQRWAWTNFPEYIYQYQQPSFLSQSYHSQFYFQGHHCNPIILSGKPTSPSHVLNADFREEVQQLESNEKFGLCGGRERTIGPRLMEKRKGISSNINRKKRSSFCGKKWIEKQHMYDDQKGNVFGPENSNSSINVAIIPERGTGIIEAGSIKCNDVCGPEVDNSTLLCGKTTVMIRNVPNQLGRQQLLKILEDHCRGENTEIESSSGCIDPCWSEFDFVYLPIDYRRGLNKGYAFVNFTSNTAAVRFWQAFEQLQWAYYRFEDSTFRSKKICQVCWAEIQGKEALRDNFRSRVFPEDEYRPVSMEPPSDGRRTTSQSVLIGNKKKQTK